MAGDDLTGATIDGRYRLDERLAAGAMGIVYRGERLKLGRAVAVKFLHASLADDPSRRQRFEIEARAMARLDHPYCASVIDAGLHDGTPFVVMDYIRGELLRDVLDQGRLSAPRAVALLRQVLIGLAHAHELGIVHRDVKPANIMITARTGLGEQVRILDFGLAKLREEASRGLTAGIVVGTPAYMAPEQCTGGVIDARTDLYATGVLLFELLTGRKPFVGDEPIEVLRQQLHAAPPRLADVVVDPALAAFEPIVARALAKDPEARFAAALEMVEALDAAAPDRPASASLGFAPLPAATSMAVPWSVRWQALRRRPGVLAAIGAGVVLLIGVIARLAS